MAVLSRSELRRDLGNIRYRAIIRHSPLRLRASA